MWYDVGTVSVTNGSTTVTGVGTDFISGVQVGEGLYIGGDLYEIGVINSSTQLTLSDAYLGSTATGQAYKIIPTQSLVADLSSGVADLISDFADVRDYAGNGKFNDGTQASPAITFTQDQNNGLYRIGSDNWGLAAGGAKALEIKTTGVKLDDGKKITFGAGDDLQIYHDGSNSYIKDSGTGNLWIQGSSQVNIGGANGTIGVQVNEGSSTVLRHNNAVKLTTTSTGVDVTGTVTADGLTVDGDALLSGADLTHTFKTTLPSITSSTTLLFNNRDGNSNFHDVASIAGVTAGNGGSGDIVFNTQFAGTGLRKRVEIDRTGDVSFYEDTGTTAKMVWDASAESLGLGTSSPSQKMHLVDANPKIQMTRTSDFYYGQLSADGFSAFTNTNGGAPVIFNTGNTERMRIDSAGNVGIGTASPSKRLSMTLSSPYDDGISVYNGFNTWQYKYGVGGQSSQYHDITYNGVVMERNYGSSIRAFYTGGTERARIDSSGNLLVGTTSTTPWTANSGTLSDNGIVCRADGLLTASTYRPTAGSGNALVLNRTSTDGSIAEFRKNGSTVGSIGSVVGQYLRIGTGNAGIMFQNGTSAIEPRTESANNDASINLGASSNRWKDLYLSGGVYLGGTGAANKLDDYEEGVFTPTVFGATTAGVGTYSTQSGRYTKVGNKVFIEIVLAWSSHTGTGGMRINALPFTTGGARQTFQMTAEGLSYSGIPKVLNFGSNNTVLQLFQQTSGGLGVLPVDTAVSYMVITGSYQTNS